MGRLSINDVQSRARDFVTRSGLAGDLLDITDGKGARLFNILLSSSVAGVVVDVYDNTVASGDRIRLVSFTDYAFSKSFGDAGLEFANGLSLAWSGAAAGASEIATLVYLVDGE